MRPAGSTAAVRLALAAAAGVVAAVTGAGVASAHVTVNPREAEQGGYARLDFRVPNERDEASTTELAVHFPEESPFGSVSTAPVPGWSVEVAYRTLDEPVETGNGGTLSEAVETITWTAEGDDAAIRPGQFREFPISLGPLPTDVDQLFFRALQTYSDGEVVRWIELPAEAGGEVENPAPVLRLSPAGAADGGGEEPDAPAADAGAAGSEEGDSGAGEAAAAADSGSGGGSGAAIWLGLAGLVAGLAGLALGGVALARTRRS